MHVWNRGSQNFSAKDSENLSGHQNLKRRSRTSDRGGGQINRQLTTLATPGELRELMKHSLAFIVMMRDLFSNPEMRCPDSEQGHGERVVISACQGFNIPIPAEVANYLAKLSEDCLLQLGDAADILAGLEAARNISNHRTGSGIIIPIV